MSADNWAQCPRCTAVRTAEFKARDAAIQASYGAVSVSEFDEARRALAADMAKFEDREPTFREDYEIYGAESGTVKVRYGGSCDDCGLSLSFDEEHPIPDWDKS